VNDYLKIIFPASVALIGTLITVFIGYRQWKRQQNNARYASFIVDKQVAYKGLWEKLEEVHVKLRTERLSVADFNNLMLGVNRYILRNALYLEEQDKVLSNHYLETVRRLKELVVSSRNERAEKELSITREIPEEVINATRELRSVVDEVDLTRKSIIDRFRKIIGGKLINE